MNERRVLPADHPLVLQVATDFRLEENGAPWVVRMRGEGRFHSSVFPEFSHSNRNVLLELIPRKDWERPGFLVRWLVALRLPYLLFSFLPLFLVSALHYAERGFLPWRETGLLFASVLLVHMSCNLWGDYEDHLRGVDSPEHSGGSGVVQKLWIPALHLKLAAAALMVLGIGLGVLLLSFLPMDFVGRHLLLLAVLGALGAAGYSGWPFHYKYLGLGEPVIFLLSGPLVTLGASYILFGDHERLFFFAGISLPLAFLAVLRLHGGNLQRIPFDSMAGSFTIARWLKFSLSKWALGFLFLSPFLAVAGLWLLGIVPNFALVAFASLPVALLAFSPLRAAQGPLDPACYELRELGARLHLAFGLLYAGSFFF